MDWLHLLQILAVIIAVGVALGAGVGGFFYAFKSKSNKLLKEKVEELQINFSTCEDQHKTSLSLIHKLEGRIEGMKDIPLQEIARAMNGISESNNKILQVLSNSAIIAAEDRSDLLNPSQHIDTQIVDKQVVKK